MPHCDAQEESAKQVEKPVLVSMSLEAGKLFPRSSASVLGLAQSVPDFLPDLLKEKALDAS